MSDPTTGVLPHSSPNLIYTAVEQQATNGTPYLTTLYSGSKLASFDLHSFWYRCVDDTVEGVVTVATECTITVAGFRNNQEVALASYSFTPTVANDALASMVEAVLPSKFVTLQNITFIQGDPNTQVIALDDISVTTHT